MHVVSEVSSHEVTDILRSAAFISGSELLLKQEIHLCLIQLLAIRNVFIIYKRHKKAGFEISATFLCFVGNSTVLHFKRRW